MPEGPKPAKSNGLFAGLGGRWDFKASLNPKPYNAYTPCTSPPGSVNPLATEPEALYNGLLMGTSLDEGPFFDRYSTYNMPAPPPPNNKTTLFFSRSKPKA